MTALLIVAIVVTGLMFVVDTAVFITADGFDDADAIAAVNLFPLALAIVALSLALGKV